MKCKCCAQPLGQFHLQWCEFTKLSLKKMNIENAKIPLMAFRTYATSALVEKNHCTQNKGTR